MPWVLAAIADDADGERFAQLRDSEISIGHESELVVALSRSPIVVDLAAVVYRLRH